VADTVIEAQKMKPIYVNRSTMMSSSVSPMPQATPEAELTMATTSPDLTSEMFLHHMTAMRLHYQGGDGQGNGPSHAYALPIHLLHPITPQGVLSVHAAATSSGKAKVDAVIKKGQTEQTALVKRQRDFVTAQTNTLQGTHDTAAFAAAMNAQKQQAKAEADKQIDAQYDQLIKIGTEHPELQAPILSTAQQIGAFLTSLIASVGTFFRDLYNKIVGWIHSAVDWIKGAAADAAKWVSGAVSSVEHFAKSILSLF